jgi:pseudouridine kinase
MKSQPIFYVIGGANIDCVATPVKDIHPKDSNPATIKTAFGGVARNIAANLSLYRQRVKFLTIFSTDGFGKDMLDDLTKMKVNTSSCVLSPNPSSMYLALLDEKQDLLMAMVDTSLLNELTSEQIVKFLEPSTENDIVVFDTNLDQSLIQTIIEHAKGTLVCDPISIAKGNKVIDYLDRIQIFKPNKLQTEILSGIKIIDDQTLIEACHYFTNKGVNELIITLGDQGGVLVTKQSILRYTTGPFDIVNVVGAGDAFISAYIAFRYQYDKMKTLQLSVAAAIKTCQCIDTVNQELSVDELNRIVSSSTIEIKELYRENK